MKVTVITHLSPTHPLIISDFIKSISISLDEEHEFSKHFISADAGNNSVIEEVQKILMDDVDCIIVYSHILNLVKIEKLVQQLHKKAILLDSNTQIRPLTNSSSNVIWLSMQHIEASVYIITQLNLSQERIAVLTDFSFSGYHIGTHFIEACQQKGSTICYQFAAVKMTHIKHNIDNIVTDFIQEKPSIVYINGQGKEASLFLSLSKHPQILEHLPNLKWVINSEYFQQLSLKSELWQKNIFVNSVWHPDENPNHPFVIEFVAETNRNPNLFAIIGYEAAMIVNQLNEKVIKNIDSPRGKLLWNPENKTFKSSIKSFIFNEKEKLMQREFNKELLPLSIDCNLQNEPLLSGWKNTYMCH